MKRSLSPPRWEQLHGRQWSCTTAGAAGGCTGQGAAAVPGGSTGLGAGDRVLGVGTGSWLLPHQSHQPQAAARLPRPACPAVSSQPTCFSAQMRLKHLRFVTQSCAYFPIHSVRQSCCWRCVLAVVFTKLLKSRGAS